MKDRLKNIIDNNRKILSELKITIEEVEDSELDFIENAEQVDLINGGAFARITLFESCRLYIQILDMETEETVYFFDDYLDNNENLEEFIIQAIRKMDSD